MAEHFTIFLLHCFVCFYDMRLYKIFFYYSSYVFFYDPGLFLLFFLSSCLVVPEPPVVWSHVCCCFLVCEKIHLAQGELVVAEFLDYTRNQKKSHVLTI